MLLCKKLVWTGGGGPLEGRFLGRESESDGSRGDCVGVEFLGGEAIVCASLLASVSGGRCARCSIE